MLDRTYIIAGLEIGTSKVRAVVATVGPSGGLNVIGVGEACSRGVRKGEITDAATTSDDIRNALVDAEQNADVEIRTVYLAVTGGHVMGFNNRGVHPVVSSDREITEEDVRDVVKNAKAMNLPPDHRVIHVIRQHFSVDGQEGIVNPVGLLGARIEVDLHVIHGHFNRLQNAIRAVKALQIDVEDVVFNGLASSLAVLTPQQKEMGAIVIDLGGGTTEYLLYLNGVVRHSGVLAVGGDHVTNDLAHGLKVPQSRAEQLKLSHGSALATGGEIAQTIQLGGDVGLPGRSIQVAPLRRIMSLRIEEIFQLIFGELQELPSIDYVRSGVVLCGGGARTRGIQGLASEVFGLPVSVGSAVHVNGPQKIIEQPSYATAIGLAKFGAFEVIKRRERSRRGRGIRNTLRELFRVA